MRNLSNVQNACLPLYKKIVSQTIKELELTVMKDLSNVQDALKLVDSKTIKSISCHFYDLILFCEQLQILVDV
jgi:hypothetical protein